MKLVWINSNAFSLALCVLLCKPKICLQILMYNYFFHLGEFMTQNTSANSSMSSSSKEQASISLPPSVFDHYPNTTLNFTLLFTMFNSSVLLPQSNVTDPRTRVASNVIGTTVLDHEVVDLDDDITITLRLEYPVSVSLSKRMYSVFHCNQFFSNDMLAQHFLTFILCIMCSYLFIGFARPCLCCMGPNSSR